MHRWQLHRAGRAAEMRPDGHRELSQNGDTEHGRGHGENAPCTGPVPPAPPPGEGTEAGKQEMHEDTAMARTPAPAPGPTPRATPAPRGSPRTAVPEPKPVWVAGHCGRLLPSLTRPRLLSQTIRIQANGGVFMNSIYTQLPVSAGTRPWASGAPGQLSVASGGSTAPQGHFTTCKVGCPWPAYGCRGDPVSGTLGAWCLTGLWPRPAGT